MAVVEQCDYLEIHRQEIYPATASRWQSLVIQVISDPPCLSPGVPVHVGGHKCVQTYTSLLDASGISQHL